MALGWQSVCENPRRMCWADFEAGAPELSRAARSLIERHGFLYAGTIRRDGGPRISPVEAHLVRGRLMLVIVAGSQKARDLARDPRLTLQSPIPNPGDPGAELKVRGRVTEVDDDQRAATTGAVEAASGWRPRPSWRFLAVELEAVALLVWERGDMVLSRWDRREGLRPRMRLQLDPEASEYRPWE
jgi:Pyridoxamine 5'-phosphate oxidase